MNAAATRKPQTSRRSPHAAATRAHRTTRRNIFARRVLPEFLRLLAERVRRSAATINGRTITALLESAAATAGIVAMPAGAEGEDWGDAASLTTELYDRLLVTRRARCGPTPNRVPHRDYAPAELRMAAEALLAAHTTGGREGGEA